MRNGSRSASWSRSATISGPAPNDAPSARTTNSSPPSRPDRVALAQDADEAMGDGLQDLVAGVVAQASR